MVIFWMLIGHILSGKSPEHSDEMILFPGQFVYAYFQCINTSVGMAVPNNIFDRSPMNGKVECVAYLLPVMSVTLLNVCVRAFYGVDYLVINTARLLIQSIEHV